MNSCFIYTVLLLLITSVAHSEGNAKFNDISQIQSHFESELSTEQNGTLDQSKIITIEADLNGDNRKDYWLVYPPIQCTDSECFGFAYLNVNNDYCFAGKGHKESDLYAGVPLKINCI